MFSYFAIYVAIHIETYDMYLLMIWALVEESSLNLWLQWHVFAHDDVI